MGWLLTFFLHINVLKMKIHLNELLKWLLENRRDIEIISYRKGNVLAKKSKV